MNKCPKCGCRGLQKNGSVGGKAKKRCKGCGYQFTREKLLGVSTQTKKMAIHMYLEGLGFRAIGRVLGVSNVAVLKWVRDAGNKIEQIHKEQDKPHFTSVIEVDEMWHYIGKKNKNFGSGSLMIGKEEGLSTSSAEIVMISRASSFSKE